MPISLSVSQVDFNDTERLSSELIESEVLVYAPAHDRTNLELVTELEQIIAAAKMSGVENVIFIGSVYDEVTSKYELAAFNAYAYRRLSACDIKATIIKTPLIIDDIISQVAANVEQKKLYYPNCLNELKYIHSNELAFACAIVANNVEEWYQTIYLVSDDYVNPDLLRQAIKDVYKKKYSIELMTVHNEQINSLVKALKTERIEYPSDFERITGRRMFDLKELLAKEKPEKQGLFSRFGKKNK